MKIIADKNDFINIAIDESNEIEIDLYCEGGKTKTYYVMIKPERELFLFESQFPKHLERKYKLKEKSNEL